jgi:hypothetical protein
MLSIDGAAEGASLAGVFMRALYSSSHHCLPSREKSPIALDEVVDGRPRIEEVPGRYAAC